MEQFPQIFLYRKINEKQHFDAKICQCTALNFQIKVLNFQNKTEKS